MVACAVDFNLSEISGKEEAPADGGDWPGLLGSLGGTCDGEGKPITAATKHLC